MRTNRTVAGMAIATMLVAGLGVAGATSAAAQDDGPALSGNIYFLNNNVAGLANATAADQVTGGTYAGRPFTGMAVDASCPAGTAMVNTWVRLKTAAVEEQWEEVFLTGSQEYKEDANGHAYILPEEGFDNFAVNQIQTFLGGTDGDLPIAFICADALGAPYGYFSTTLHLQATKATTGTWSQLNPVLIARTATTTTLTATPATAEVGSAVALSASVSAAGATGSIEFFDGTTSLGTSAIAAGTAGLSVSNLSVGTHSITATYLGDTGYETSTSAASSVEITPVAARETTTTLAADVVSGAPYQNVTLTASVTASLGTPAGTVTFKDGATVLGSAPVDATGVATLTKNTLGAGAHALTAVFTGSAPYSDSTSTEVAAAYTATGATDEQTVTVDIPAGAITITTPYTEASPLSLGIAVLDSSDSTYSASAKFGDATDAAKAIKITDTRAGSTGFVAQVQSGDFTNGTSTFGGKYAGLTGVQAIQLAGNALQATDIVPTDHVAYTDGLESAKVFATYHPAVPTLGTALLEGTFSVDQVPSSVTPGTYTATVIFTAN